MKSTSLHRLNADKNRKGLRALFFGPAWFALNWLNNHFLPDAVRHLQMGAFIPRLSDADWERVHIKDSPSRKLSDLFWMQIPWEQVRAALGGLRLLDVGCGSGHYYEWLQACSGNGIATYTGVDVAPRDSWQELSRAHPDVSFHRVDSAEIYAAIPADVNLLISQSAIEHFEQDLGFFSQVARFVQARGQELIQVHLIPSPAGLPLYLLHGVRQYTPHSADRIARLFEPFSYSVLYAMGGRACNRLHREAITQPSLRHAADLRDRDPQAYDRALRQAILADSRDPRQPSFYALVIHSHARQRIFQPVIDQG